MLASRVLMSPWDLPRLLTLIAEDDDPVTAEHWVVLSRGVIMIEDGVIVPATDVANYKPRTAELAALAPKELQRNIDLKYILPTFGSVQRRSEKNTRPPLPVFVIH